MKRQPATLALLLALSLSASAGDVVKANNNTALNQASSWVANGPPGNLDVAVWDATFAPVGGTPPALGASQVWSGIRIANPVTAPQIRVFGTTNFLTLGTTGIDMSAANQDFLIGPKVTLGSAQSWTVAASRVLTLSSELTGAGLTLTKAGPGTLKLTGPATGGAITFTANIDIAGGTLQLSPTIGGTQTLSGTLSGAGEVLKDGAGALTLGVANSHSGGTTLSAGQLNLNHANALGGGVLTITGIGCSLDNTSGAPVTLAANTQNWNADFSFVGSSNLNLGPGSVTVSGNPILTVTANSLVTGGTVGGTGNLTKAGAGTLEIATGAAVAIGGQMGVAAGDLKLTGGSLTCASLVFGGSSTAAFLLNGGTLSTASISRTAGAATFYFNGGTLMPSNGSSTFMTGLTSANVSAGGAVIDPNGFFGTIAQPLLHDPALGATPDGGLRVNDSFGGGKLTLTGAATYTGPTVVQSGTLALGAGGSIASSPVIDVQTSGVLDTVTAATIASGQTLQGIGTVIGNLTVGAGGNLSPSGVTIGTLSLFDTLTLAGNATFQIDKAGASLTSDFVSGMQQVTYGGTLTVSATGLALTNGNTFTLFDAATYSGSFATLALPTLTAGLFWDTSSLTIDGTIKVINTLPTPTFNPPSGVYLGAQSVTIASTSGSTIHYTTDGSNPITSETALSGPSPIVGVEVPTNTASFTIKAYATMAAATSSAVGTSVYQTLTYPVWTNDGGGNWSEPANWLGGLVANGNGVTAKFNTLTLSSPISVTNDGARTIGGMVFGDVGDLQSWTVGGTAALTLAAPSQPVITVENQVATINPPLAGSQGLVKNGPGRLILTNNCSFTGNTVVNEGVLQLGRSNYSFNNSQLLGMLTVNSPGALQMTDLAFGWGGGLTTLNLNGATVTGSSGFGSFGVVYNLRGATINSSARLDFANSSGQPTAVNSLASSVTSVITLTHAEGMMIRVDASGVATFNVETGTTPSGVDLQVNNRIVPNGGAGTLVKNGTGTLEFTSGTSTYSGGSTVSGGTLLLNNSSGTATGSGAVAVNTGAILGGSGAASGGVTINANAFIAPGATASGIGTLATGAATLAGTYQCQVGGATTDKITVTGNLNLTGSALAVSAVSTPTPGTYVIATYTGTLTGTFSSVTPGYTVDYATPNQVKLVVSGSGSGYQTWVGGFGLTGNNALAAADPDRDGVSNGVEYVVGGNPAAVMDASLLPTLTLVTANVGNGSQNYMKFTYRRTKASADALVTAACEYNTGLSGTWTTATTGVAGVVVQTTPSGFSASPQVDRVDVYVPQSLSAAGKLFGRLRVNIP